MSLNLSVRWIAGAAPVKLPKTPRDLGSLGEEITWLVSHPLNDLILIGTSSGKVVVGDPTDGALVGAIEAHTQDVSHISFFNEGNRFLTSAIDHTVKLWDAQFSQEREYRIGAAVYTLSIAPNEEEFATGGPDRILRIWDIQTGKLVQQMPALQDPISASVWLKKDHVVTADVQGRLTFWEAHIGRPMKQWQAHRDQVSVLISNKKGGWYASGSWDGSIKIWSGHHRERFEMVDGSAAVTALAFTTDEMYLVAGYWDGVVRLWSLESGRLFDEFQAFDTPLAACVVLPGGDSFVTAAQSGEIRSWSIAEMGRVYYQNRHNGNVFAVKYTPDNLLALSVGNDGQLKVWDRNECCEAGYLDIHNQPVLSLAVSPDNRFWAVGTEDGLIKLWDVQGQTFDSSFPAHSASVSGLRFLATNDRLISCSWDMRLKLWLLQTQFEMTYFDGHTKEIAACDISQDGRRLASASWDGSVRVWDLANADREYGTQLLLLEGHHERVLCCTFTPDGSYLITGGADKTVRIWSAEKATPPLILEEHEDAITCCAITPDGQVLITGDMARTVVFWDVVNGQVLEKLIHDYPLLSIAIAPDGEQAVLGDEEGNVRFFSMSYPQAPAWIAAVTFYKQPPVWKRGAPPIESFGVTCMYCGKVSEITKKNLGEIWRCPQCKNVLRLCPRTLLPYKSLVN